ncbi:TRAM domain-containing protein, partial [Paenibacillus sp. TAF58]
HYLQLARKIKETMPDVVLTTDIIVGFPGETDEQFDETMSLYEEVGFDFAFTFIYSPREGTPAADMEDNVPMEVKKQRLYRLNELVNKHSKASNESLLGQTVEVLVEGESKNNADVLAGRTRTNKLIHFTGDKSLIGQMVEVEVTHAQTWILKGEIVHKPMKISI